MEGGLAKVEAESLLRHVHEQLGQIERFEDYWKRLPVPEAWTIGLLRQYIRTLIEPQKKPLAEFLQLLADRVARESGQSTVVAKQARQELVEYRREHLLPKTETLEKVMRYESHLSRQLHRDLHELERLQARRQGQSVPAPIVVDVDAVGVPNLPPPQ